MSTPALPAGTGAPTGAHLLIHTTEGTPIGRGQRLQALVRQVRVHLLGAAHPADGLLALAVQDQQGQSVLELDLAGPLVDIVLAPGIYRVTAQRGTTRRSYTVVLSPGSSLDLQLPPPAR